MRRVLKYHLKRHFCDQTDAIISWIGEMIKSTDECLFKVFLKQHFRVQKG